MNEAHPGNKWARLTEGERLYASMRDAAPELYEALDAFPILSVGQTNEALVEWVEKARNALAKARGETPNG